MNRKIISVAMAIVLCIGMLLISEPASAAVGSVPTIRGEKSRTTKEITLTDGTKTGVIHTQIKLDGYYGDNRVVNVAEGDLSNRNLSLEFLTPGTYMVNSRTMTSASRFYNDNHLGQTVLAAVNGDLYMIGTHSGSSVTKKILGVPRGILMVDGEIWASAQIDQENLGATNSEKGQPAGLRPAFGVTAHNQPVVGKPVITTELNIGGKQIKADGINRLPAMDSIIVYNHRVNSSNYALNDAYEVVITVDETSHFKAGSTVSGTITKIYASGSTSRPSLADENVIVLTARGSRLSELQALCSVGKRVTISTSIYDELGRTDLWQDVQDAIGGHFPTIIDGEEFPINQSSYYPTTLVGYKNDGTVALVTVTSALDNSRAALKMSQAHEICRELGYNSVFFLDGGGSTTFVTLEEGSYTVRNKCSDGYTRSVKGGIGFVWNDDPVCMRQGHLNYIHKSVDLTQVTPEYISGAMLTDLTVNPNCVDLSFNKSENAFAFKVNTATSDPFATLNYTKLKSVNAENYSHIVMKVKSTLRTSNKFLLYYSCGSDTGPSQDRIAMADISGSGGWQYITFNMKGLNGWNGAINNIRLDVFNSGQMKTGDTMYIDSIILCKNDTEVDNAKSGWKPAGACLDYLQRLEASKPTPYFICGDIDGDGDNTLLDLFKMKAILAGKNTPQGATKYSADVDGDGDITMLDSFEMKFRLVRGVWCWERARTNTLLSDISPERMDGVLLEKLMVSPNGVSLSYSNTEDALCMKVNTTTNDPFATLDLTRLKRVKAEDYGYVVFKVKTNVKANNSFGIYYACGSDTGAAEERSVKTTIYAKSDWQYIVFNMKDLTGWNGNINNMRIDIFNAGYMQAGDAVYIKSVSLCKSAEDLSKLING